MLLLDEMRREFADFLSNDPAGRWRMDAALAHVVTLAYNKGMADGAEGVWAYEAVEIRRLLALEDDEMREKLRHAVETYYAKLFTDH